MSGIVTLTDSQQEVTDWLRSLPSCTPKLRIERWNIGSLDIQIEGFWRLDEIVSEECGHKHGGGQGRPSFKWKNGRFVSGSPLGAGGRRWDSITSIRNDVDRQVEIAYATRGQHDEQEIRKNMTTRRTYL